MAILCHCERVTEHVIAAAVGAGARSIEEIGAHCGAGNVCGGCHPWIDALLAERPRCPIGVSSSA
jgi:bacterioferritin-associated ferredoxin